MKQKKTDANGSFGLVFCKTPEEYTHFDFRASKPIYYVENIDENGEQIGDKGAVIQEIEELKFNNSNKLQYFVPNNVAVLLSITNKSLANAKIIFESNVDPNKHNHTLKSASGDRKDFLIKKSIILYDFIEHIQSCIVFSYTALEAFANLSIPKDYKYESRIENKGISEIYDKIAIEKWINLKQKLSNILVDIYKTDDITKKPIWSHFIKLEQLRHDIIHQKSIDKVEFYKKYFNRDVFKACSCAEEIIDFFYKQHGKNKRSNQLWPWLINKENHFPMTKYKTENFEKLGNIND